MPVPIEEAHKDIAVDVHVITEEELLKGPYLFMGEWRNNEMIEEVNTVPENEKEFTYFGAKMDFEALDKKLQRFVELRNELKMLAKEIGFEVEHGLLELRVK